MAETVASHLEQARAKRSRVAFGLSDVRRRPAATPHSAFVLPADESSDEPFEEAPSAAKPNLGHGSSHDAVGNGICNLAAYDIKSPMLEHYLGSLRARNGPLFRQYRALLSGERGLSSGPDQPPEAIGLGEIASLVDALVQVADLRVAQQKDKAAETEQSEELLTAACKLFECLCHAVAALPSVGSPDLYVEGLRRRWGGGDVGDCEWQVAALKATILFRMKDSISSLFAWGLLTRAVSAQMLTVLRLNGVSGIVRFLDPIAGTGFQGAILQAAGAEIMLADSVHGGSTQSSGADTDYLVQCSMPGPPIGNTVPKERASSDISVIWKSARRLCVFDDSTEAAAWWQLPGTDENTSVGNAGDVTTALFLSFPPPPPSAVAEAALGRFNGSWLVFLGEWRGCTATAAFFDQLEVSWELLERISLPRWPMMDDYIYVLRRRSTKAPTSEAAADGNLVQQR